MTLCTV